MPFVVRPLQEADGPMEEASRVQYAAFRRPARMGIILSPAPEPSAEFITSSITRRREAMRSNKAARFMTVVDSETDKVIALAHWDIYTNERTEEQVEKQCRLPPCPPDSHPEAWNDFFGHFSESRKKLGTRPIAILQTLVTHPAYQGRGAGKLLLQEMVREVDACGVEAYLEASQEGMPLYARFGFVPQYKKEFDMSKYGAQGQDINTIMIRLPHTPPAQTSGSGASSESTPI